MADDDDRPTPPTVTTAVAVGTAPLPFLAVYTALFLLHGLVHPVHPPDITSSQRGEVIAGCITGALFVLLSIAIVWFLNGRRRWLFALLQLAVVAAAVDFLIDSTRGGGPISVLLMVAAGVALVVAFAPDGWTHVGRRCPSVVAAPYRVVGLGPRATEDPSETRYSPAR